MDKLQAVAITRRSPWLAQARALYREAFPPAERTPLWFLLARARAPHIAFSAFIDQAGKKPAFAGLAYTIEHEGLVYVMYLAVNPAVRSRGYGTRILAQLRATYPTSIIALDIEDPATPAPNPEQRTRRQAFYAKCGYTPSGVAMSDKSGRYLTLTNGYEGEGRDLIPRLNALFKRFSTPLLYPFAHPRLKLA
jgi:GNAT superfamily N-acetyltransferase